MELHHSAEAVDGGWRQGLPATVATYLESLPLTPEQRATLGDRVRAKHHDCAEAALIELHRLLHESHSDPDQGHPARNSVGSRLRMAHGELTDLHGRPLLQADRHQQLHLLSMPPLNRATMVPYPWSTNPLTRMLRWFKRTVLGNRGHLVSRGDDSNEPAQTDHVNKVHWHWSGTLRRITLLILILLQTVIATYYMAAVLPYHGTHKLEACILVIYAVLFSWVSAGFWTALMGFFVLMKGGDRYSISATAPEDAPIHTGARTAILMPIRNESVGNVMAGLRSTYESVQRAGMLDQFDFFLLSDSDDPTTRVQETEAWRQLCAEIGGFGRIFYRRRRHRIKRKSGNIADFCRRWGSNYRYMVVMDADSVMSGECLKRLVQLMEGNPQTGIIQTAPRAAGRDTLYARIQQFSTRVYGPLFTAGLHFWQLGESHYWGHNAIIRVAPFIRHCALPRLPGRGALSGEILSHDFVEAALMRRAGWSVWIAYDLPGSYEEMPPNLLDELNRDRRWCQGNLQNFRLFFAQGLHPAHRAVFMTGVMAYLSAPLWFLFLAMSTALLTMQALTPPQYFVEPYQLFPIWPEWHPGWAIALFSATATLLFLPKILAVLLLLFKGARDYGGRIRLTASMAVELVFSALLAPIRMLFHTQFIISALAGWATQWKSPSREDHETTWTEALTKHGLGSLFGAVWAGGMYYVNPEYLWWLAPIVGALVIAMPLSVYSSRRRLGEGFRRAGLFLIPEETAPPRELIDVNTYVNSFNVDIRLQTVVADPTINALVCATGTGRRRLPEQNRRTRERLINQALTQGVESLSHQEQNTLLNDPNALSDLHLKWWSLRRSPSIKGNNV